MKFDKTIFDSIPLDYPLIMKGVVRLFEDNMNIVPQKHVYISEDRAKNINLFFKKIREIPEFDKLLLDLAHQFKVIEIYGAERFADVLSRYAAKQDKILSLVKKETDG